MYKSFYYYYTGERENDAWELGTYVKKKIRIKFISFDGLKVKHSKLVKYTVFLV